MSGLVKAVENIVGDVAHAVGSVVSTVAHTVGTVINSAIQDPLGTISEIGTAIFAPELLPLVVAADSAAHGASIGKILTSAATAYVGGQVGAGISSAIGSSAGVAGADAASTGALSDATSAIKGFTGDLSNATGISQATLNSGLSNAAVAAGKAALTGGNALDAAISSGVNTGVGAEVGDVTGSKTAGNFAGSIASSSANSLLNPTTPTTSTTPETPVAPSISPTASGAAPDLSKLSGTQMASYMGALSNPGTTPADAYATATGTNSNATPGVGTDANNIPTARAVAPTYTRAGSPIDPSAGASSMPAPELYNAIAPTGTRYAVAPTPTMASGPSDLQLDQSIANGTPVAAVGATANSDNMAGYAKGGLAHFDDGGAATTTTTGAPDPTASPLGSVFGSMTKNLKAAIPEFPAHPANMLSIGKPPTTFGAPVPVSPSVPVLNLAEARHYQFHAQGGGIHTDPNIQGVSGLGSLHEGGNPAFHYAGAPEDHHPEFITGATGYHVQGKGTGQSDDIPAMLADGEYVFDADTVSALGDGSNKAGAEVLNKMREALRAHKRSAPNDKIPPPAKTPLEYMKKALKG